MNLSFLSMFIDSSKVGGWTRAVVASALTTVLIKYPVLSPFVDPSVQAAVATAVSGIVVGIWSHLTKTASA